MLPLLKDKTPILIVTKPKGIIPSQINFFFSLGIIMHLLIQSYSLFSCESINLHLCIICECMTFWFLLNWNFQFLSSYRFQLSHFFILQKNCQIQEEIHVSRSFFYNIVHVVVYLGLKEWYKLHKMLYFTFFSFFPPFFGLVILPKYRTYSCVSRLEIHYISFDCAWMLDEANQYLNSLQSQMRLQFRYWLNFHFFVIYCLHLCSLKSLLIETIERLLV